MTEEEIMKQLKKACILDPLCYEVDCLYEEDLNAIRSLVDLYRKQKEDIMYLRMDVQELADDVEFWQDRCDDSVDKEDMRNKIEELEDKMEQCRKEYGNNTNEDYNWYLAQKRILEEMVKEY